MLTLGGTARFQAIAMGSATGMVVVILAGCGWNPGSMNERPSGATSSRAAVTAFLRALERRDVAGMRQVMTPKAQHDEQVQGGLLQKPPKLTSFRVRDERPEDPGNNASPRGSTASLRYTVRLTPAGGFDDDDATGSAYATLVSETRDKRWLVAELGGCC